MSHRISETTSGLTDLQGSGLEGSDVLGVSKVHGQLRSGLDRGFRTSKSENGRAGTNLDFAVH